MGVEAQQGVEERTRRPEQGGRKPAGSAPSVLHAARRVCHPAAALSGSFAVGPMSWGGNFKGSLPAVLH